MVLLKLNAVVSSIHLIFSSFGRSISLYALAAIVGVIAACDGQSPESASGLNQTPQNPTGIDFKLSTRSVSDIRLPTAISAASALEL